jgi:hypothetical protein
MWRRARRGDACGDDFYRSPIDYERAKLDGHVETSEVDACAASLIDNDLGRRAAVDDGCPVFGRDGELGLVGQDPNDPGPRQRGRSESTIVADARLHPDGKR